VWVSLVWTLAQPSSLCGLQESLAQPSSLCGLQASLTALRLRGRGPTLFPQRLP
jgi:hypothetical protein